MWRPRPLAAVHDLISALGQAAPTIDTTPVQPEDIA